MTKILMLDIIENGRKVAELDITGQTGLDLEPEFDFLEEVGRTWEYRHTTLEAIRKERERNDILYNNRLLKRQALSPGREG